MSDMMRRLPVYLLLDTSGSMTGQPIEAVRQGVRALLADIRSDPQALETVWVSVIAFSSTAQQVSPLTELSAFREPTLEAGGSTALGAALELLEQCVGREVRKAGPAQKGDWRPLVFLMTDGQPTDNWETAADRVRNARLGNVVALAAGHAADSDVLKRITDTVVRLDELQPDSLKAFFKWVAGSIKTTARSMALAIDGPIDLPPPPPHLQVIE